MMHDVILIGFGLAVGLWAAANVWIWRYAAGYRAGVAFCTKEITAFQAELALRSEGAQMGPAMHHVSEEMRLRMKAQAEGEGETRH